MATYEQAKAVANKLKESHPDPNKFQFGLGKIKDDFCVQVRTNKEIQLPSQIDGVPIQVKPLEKARALHHHDENEQQRRQQILQQTNQAYQKIKDNPTLSQQLQEETQLYDNTSADGLD